MSDSRNSIVCARGLSVMTRDGLLFSDVTFDAPEGQVTALCGEDDLSMTALLLCMAGAVKRFEGELTVAGCQLPGQRAKVRRLVGLGFFPGFNDVEASLMLDTAVRAELSLYGKRSEHEDAIEYLRLWGLSEFAGVRVENLTVEQFVRFGIALGMVGDPALLLVAGIERGLDQHQARRLMAYLRLLTQDRSLSIAVGCVEPDIACGADKVVYLSTSPEAPSELEEGDA